MPAAYETTAQRMTNSVEMNNAFRIPNDRMIAEISATQAMEGNPLSVQDKKDLIAYLESTDRKTFKRKYIEELCKVCD